MGPRHSNEKKILLQALVSAVGENISIQRDDLKVDENWLLERAEHHRLTPYLSDLLQTSDLFDCFSPAVAQKLKVSPIENRHVYEWRKSQWTEARALLDGLEVDYVPLKGAALAYSIYEKPYRQMWDFDILVRKRELGKLLDGLQSLGFKPGLPTRFRFHEACRRYKLADALNNVDYQGRAELQRGGMSFDLHWAPSYAKEGETVGIRPEYLWEHAKLGQGHGYELALPLQGLYSIAHAWPGTSTLLTHWLDFLKLRLNPAWVREMILLPEFLIASPEARQGVLAFYEQVVETVENVKANRAFANPLVDPLFYTGVPQGADFSWKEFTKQRRKDRARLPLRLRILHLLGYALPDFSFYSSKGIAWWPATLTFYARNLMSLRRLIQKFAKSLLKASR